MTDKITAELMALARQSQHAYYYARTGKEPPPDLPSSVEADITLEQAIRRAVDWKQVGVSLYNPPSLSYGVKWSITEPLPHGTPIYARSQA